MKMTHILVLILMIFVLGFSQDALANRDIEARGPDGTVERGLEGVDRSSSSRLPFHHDDYDSIEPEDYDNYDGTYGNGFGTGLAGVLFPPMPEGGSEGSGGTPQAEGDSNGTASGSTPTNEGSSDAGNTNAGNAGNAVPNGGNPVANPNANNQGGGGDANAPTAPNVEDLFESGDDFASSTDSGTGLTTTSHDGTVTVSDGDGNVVSQTPSSSSTSTETSATWTNPDGSTGSWTPS